MESLTLLYTDRESLQLQRAYVHDADAKERIQARIDEINQKIEYITGEEQ